MFEPRHFRVPELADTNWGDLLLMRMNKRPYSLSDQFSRSAMLESLGNISLCFHLRFAGWRLSSPGAKGSNLYRFKN